MLKNGKLGQNLGNRREEEKVGASILSHLIKGEQMCSEEANRQKRKYFNKACLCPFGHLGGILQFKSD